MNDTKELDWDRLEETGLAILSLTLHEGNRAWKGFSWDLTDRWHEKGWILDPRGKAKSVVMTPEGVEKAGEVLREQFNRTANQRMATEEEPSDCSGHLHGWDDEKVYFRMKDGRDVCVSDDDALYRKLCTLCDSHFDIRSPIRK